MNIFLRQRCLCSVFQYKLYEAWLAETRTRDRLNDVYHIHTRDGCWRIAASWCFPEVTSHYLHMEMVCVWETAGHRESCIHEYSSLRCEARVFKTTGNSPFSTETSRHCWGSWWTSSLHPPPRTHTQLISPVVTADTLTAHPSWSALRVRPSDFKIPTYFCLQQVNRRWLYATLEVASSGRFSESDEIHKQRSALIYFSEKYRIFSFMFCTLLILSMCLI